jgi:hypothetical protein
MHNLSVPELIDIANNAGVLRIMSERRTSRVTVDHVPARAAMSIPREPEEENSELSVPRPDVIPVTFTLADAMFGGVIYVALTCGDIVIVNPFRWQSYEHLGTVTITPPQQR